MCMSFKKANDRIFDQGERSDMAVGGVAFILIFISVFVGSVFGLALLPDFYGFCLTASYAFNNTTYETVYDIILLLALPILYVILILSGLAGAMYGVWRVARRL